MDSRPDHWRISAIIDFGDARIGTPHYDLITPGLLIARGDRIPIIVSE
jgi:hypothetical protein